MLVLDSADYDAWAMNIARGDWIGTGVFYAMPLYPYFLGVVYFLFGHFLSAARFIQILIGATNCILAFRLAQRSFGRRAAVITFVICAFSNLLILYDSMIISSSLIVFSYLLVLNVLVSFEIKPTAPRALIAGLLTGIACLVSANTLMFIPLLCMWLFVWVFRANKKKALGYSGAFLIAAAAAIAPVTLRNYVVSKDLVLVTAHGGLNFYLGNNSSADGANAKVPFLSSGSRDMIEDSVVYAEKTLQKKLTASEVSKFWFSEGVDFIRKRPDRFLALTFTKLRLFLMGYEIPDIFLTSFYSDFVPVLRWLAYTPFTLNVIVPLAILGLPLAMRRIKRKRFFSLLCLFMAGYILPATLFLVNTRYKIPMVPVFALLSSVSLEYVYGALKGKKYRVIAIFLVSFCAAYLIINNKPLYREYRPNLGASYVFIGDHLLEKGQTADAIAQFKRAVESEPKRAEAHNMLGLGYFRGNDYENAQREFTKAIQLKPNLIGAYNNLGQLELKKGHRQAALGYFEKSMQLNPGQEAVRAIIDELKTGDHGLEK